MAIQSKTIFYNSAKEIDQIIISFSCNESLVNLSRVNKAGNQIISNVFFKKLFNEQHPTLNLNFVFTNLCSYFPDNCWKIACCAFSKGELRLSQTFISEYSPNIHKHILAEKMQLETELKEICGSYYQDPNSQIDRAWKTKQKTELLINEYAERANRLQLELDGLHMQLIEKFPEMTYVEIRQALVILLYVLQEYTEEQILKPNDEQIIDIHEKAFHFVRKNIPYNLSDVEIRTIADDGLSMALPNLCTIISYDGGSNASLIQRLRQLKSELTLLSNQKGFEDNDIFTFEGEYENLERKRNVCAFKLEKIGAQLTAFDPSGKIPLTRTLIPQACSDDGRCHIEFNRHISDYFYVLNDEFFKALLGEKATMRLPHLEECSSLIEKLLSHPEEISPDSLNSIRQMINSFDIEDVGYIWGELYHQCANGVHEHQWSENHFPEFLGDLKWIVHGSTNSYESQLDEISEPNGKEIAFHRQGPSGF